MQLIHTKLIESQKREGELNWVIARDKNETGCYPPHIFLNASNWVGINLISVKDNMVQDGTVDDI